MTTSSYDECFNCKGHGVVELEQGHHVTCHECRGSGLIITPQIQAKVDVSVIPKPDNDCPVCNGNGVIFHGSTEFGDDGSRVCPCCNGTGVYPSPAEIIKLREEHHIMTYLREVEGQALMDNIVNVLGSMFTATEGCKV